MAPVVVQGCARRVADKCNMGSEGRLLPPCLWPPRWDLLPPDSRGLILGDLGCPTCSDRSGCIRAGAHQGSPGQCTHCLRHPSLEKVTHLGRRPLGGARVAAGRRRRRWLGPRLLLSSRPARPWGRTWPGGGHPPARSRLSSHATPPALNRGVQGPRSPPCTASGGSHQPPSSSVPLGSLRAGLVTSWSAHSKVSRTDPLPSPLTHTCGGEGSGEDRMTSARLPHLKNTSNASAVYDQGQSGSFGGRLGLHRGAEPKVTSGGGFLPSSAVRARTAARVPRLTTGAGGLTVAASHFRLLRPSEMTFYLPSEVRRFQGPVGFCVGPWELLAKLEPYTHL